MTFDPQPYIDAAPNEPYVRFFNKISEFTNTPESSWSKYHVLGYFVFRFNSHYKKPYVFKYNNALPSKSFEFFQIARLGLLVSSDSMIQKSYIDWFFDHKIASRKISSISALTKDSLMEEFKSKFLDNMIHNTIKRTDTLPMNIYSIVSKSYPSIKTYGDLAFLYASSPSHLMFDDIKNIFNLEELKKVI